MIRITFQTEDVLQCFEDHQKDDRLDLICIDCQSEYDALLKEFKTLQSYGKLCCNLASLRRALLEQLHFII